MKTILVVDDSKEVRGMVRSAVEGEARCLEADNLTEASYLLVRYYEEIDVIFVDGSVTVDASAPNKDFTPEEWVRRVRRMGYGGVIVAFSASSTSRKGLMEAGCNLPFNKGSESLEVLLGLLGL